MNFPRSAATPTMSPLNLRPNTVQGLCSDARVSDEMVVAFQKLSNLLATRRRQGASLGLDECARPSVLEMLNSSTITAVEAVKTWGVTHPDYFIDASDPKCIVIRHAWLRARLAATFDDVHAAEMAMAAIILGKTVPGQGEFSVDGQALVPSENAPMVLRTCSSKSPLVH